MGATDVCPFVPVNDITMEEVVSLSKEVAERVGKELSIPVYLYEASATSEARRSLAAIRKGEYEGLEEKLKDPQWKPDFGPTTFNPSAGATVIGAREFLIAYNITLNTKEKKYATDIAFEIREKGRSARTGNIQPFYFRGKLLKYQENHYPCGNCNFVGKTIDETVKHCQKTHDYDLLKLLELHGTDAAHLIGRSVKKPGKFPHVRSIGWFVPEYGRAQISINFTNYKITPPHIVVEEVRKLAVERGLVVTGCEVVGLIPFQAIYEAGKFYLARQGRSTGVPVEDIIETAVYSLGLNDVSPFNIQKKIIGLPEIASRHLVSRKTYDLVQEVSRETPAPGGGSMAALSGAFGAALTSMVSNLTVGKAGYEVVEEEMIRLAEEAQQLKDELLKAVDDDTDAFNAYMEARRLPQNTPEQKQARKSAMEAGLKEAVNVPLNTAAKSLQALKTALEAAKKGNANSVSDAGVGAHMAFSGVLGGVLNVLINLPQIQDEQFKAEMKLKCEKLETEGREILAQTIKTVKQKIKSMEK